MFDAPKAVAANSGIIGALSEVGASTVSGSAMTVGEVLSES
ncbi:MAG: hypothetical protein ACJAVT_000744 [Yoonia sp.]|jgi:hypothetical protein